MADPVSTAAFPAALCGSTDARRRPADVVDMWDVEVLREISERARGKGDGARADRLLLRAWLAYDAHTFNAGA